MKMDKTFKCLASNFEWWSMILLGNDTCVILHSGVLFYTLSCHLTSYCFTEHAALFLACDLKKDKILLDVPFDTGRICRRAISLAAYC